MKGGDPSVNFCGALLSVTKGEVGGIHEPVFRGNERKYLLDCLDSGVVSSVGSYVLAFEQSVAAFVGSAHAVAVASGTSGLHLALIALGVKPGDEVIVPALSFVATAAAVAMAGAIPHFVDVSPDTWGLDARHLEQYLLRNFRQVGDSVVNAASGRPVTAVVPMHTLGHPCDAAGVRRVADEFGLVVVEDAAESLGSFSNGVHTGRAGQAGVFSFNGNKTVTTGGGGVVVTEDPHVAARLRHLSTTAKVTHRFEFVHDEIGFNYRMPNINAAIGLAQIEQLPTLVDWQRALKDRYQDLMEPLDMGVVRDELPGARSNFWLQAFVLSRPLAKLKNSLMSTCLDAGVAVRPLWQPLHWSRAYEHCPRAKTPVTEDLYSRVVCLPSSALLSAP